MRTPLTKNEMWTELEKRHIVRVVVEFSGGNDEGGVDGIYCWDHKDQRTEMEEDYVSTNYNEKTQKWEPEREKNLNGKLYDTLAEPVYSRYGSFAGEFYVNGQVEYDVNNRKILMQGKEI